MLLRLLRSYLTPDRRLIAGICLLQLLSSIASLYLPSLNAHIIDDGVLKTTVGEHFGRIDAANLRRAHALLESGKARGKIVLEGF